MKLSQKEAVFTSEVVTRFELYNSLFLTLPFYQVKHTGTLLPFFTSHCEEGVKQELWPVNIIESFFRQYKQYIKTADRFDLLFRFIQYIERQVVLFDAIEDSAFNKTGRSEETGSLKLLLQQSSASPVIKKQISDKLQEFSLRLVLTAHPTQFYPGTVLSIITDITEALKTNDINTIHLLLQQLGKTPFFKKKKPTPVDEAVSLAWFLENVFYQVISTMQSQIENEFELPVFDTHQLIELGFWPGGDRDGNPNVTAESTKAVSELLRKILFRCYYRDFKILKRRVTFRGVEKYIDNLQELFYENSFNTLPELKNQQANILDNLDQIKTILIETHNGLFVDIVEDMIRKVRLFGCYFASLDIRQDSRELRKAHKACRKSLKSLLPINYDDLPEQEKLLLLTFKEEDHECQNSYDLLTKDTLNTIRLMKNIQDMGGEKASHRFIISNCQQASDILQLINLFLWSGWKKNDLNIDFVPLFETVQDLESAAKVMKSLYTHPFYKKHIQRRGGKQVIMLGFSDSTKDGGYLMANWSIYKAKIELTAIARQYDVSLAFFDGRGGPPARGGGKTQRFYATMGKEIANDHIQLTIQGQTISSQYGSFDTAQYNIEQLINAGIVSSLDMNDDTLKPVQKALIDKMAIDSHKSFVALREDPLFLTYLEKFSPINLLSQINISSRPVKRNSGAELRLEDLRAISFVTAWSQVKQNIPGFYGVGTALKSIKAAGKWNDVKKLYETSGQFKTTIDNCMMSMSKSDFRIMTYVEKDKVFGKFCKKLRKEFELTKDMMLDLTDTHVLMEQYPVERMSIALRERIVLPLVIIHHYALQ
ncbi:MAG TPA: phosphoenolpyruvate carboxylase, partial [Sphingobacteriaceae bacterium]|nr:phosphoenolpyruvate carboxylase [Sphingobacteriaceae bacterium]